ncbi:MAG: DUF4824 family protein [Sulfuritalea sp.]|jgi:hypothetical protein|nr:DUF4824 family protein [Sulfuritalea sp.]
MKLTPWKTLAAGALLILLANAVALTGVYLNRSGEADSRLTLSQRELTMPWGWGMTGENSGMALALNWRVADASAGEYYGGGFGRGGGTPDWLDTERMAALGFDTAELSAGTAGRRRIERALPREVLLVLELAGPAWQQAQERARQNAARHEAARLANADSKEFAEKAKRAQEQLQREENLNSRLFAIDAGLDRAALRAKYPGRSRYLILKGTVRPRVATYEKKTRVTGYVSALAVAQINVPHALRPLLEPVLRTPRRMADGSGAHFEAVLAVGQRLEPWLESVLVTR